MNKILIQNFLNISLKIYILEENHKFIGELKPKESKTFDINVNELLKKRDKFFIRFTSNDINFIIGDYCVMKPIRMLTVGKIKCGKSYGTAGYVPIVRDMPEIHIHNLTGASLMFNDHILVPARKEIKYTGYDQSGIQSGFRLINNDGIFDDFTILRSLTNIYYGLISSE